MKNMRNMKPKNENFFRKIFMLSMFFMVNCHPSYDAR